MAANPYQDYMMQSVSTMTPGELLVALYEKAENELQKSIYFIQNGNLDRASHSLTRVQEIVATLDGSLKMKYPISDNLNQLYIFLAHQLVQANIKKDVKLIEELIPFFTDLKEAFSAITKKGY